MDLVGHWTFWSVRDEIRSDVELDSPELESITGLFLGFGSGDRKKWAERLPHLTRLKYLVSWTGYNPQSFFDAVARMTWLERLCFGRLRANDISGLRNLTDLQYLCIHQLSAPTTLRPVATLRKLRALELGLNDKIRDFADFVPNDNDLVSLRSLILYANKARIAVPSLRSLQALRSLEYLFTPTVNPADGDLACLGSLPRLKVVHVAKSWLDSEVKLLTDKGIAVERDVRFPG